MRKPSEAQTNNAKPSGFTTKSRAVPRTGAQRRILDATHRALECRCTRDRGVRGYTRRETVYGDCATFGCRDSLVLRCDLTPVCPVMCEELGTYANFRKYLYYYITDINAIIILLYMRNHDL